MAAADAPAAAPQQRGADGAFITALRSEVNTLRGIGSLGGPALDCDIDDDPSRDPSIGVEALEMAQAELQEAHDAQEKREAERTRAALQQCLESRDDQIEASREALLEYMSHLRERDDATGNAVRAGEFDALVDDMAAKGREMRDTERSSVGTAIGIMLEGCSDPKTREALLEVQRLDALLKRKGEKASAISGKKAPKPPKGGEAKGDAKGGGSSGHLTLSDKDEARVDAVLAGDDDDGPGAGYRPSAEDAAVLAEIDAILGPKFAEIAENISERASCTSVCASSSNGGGKGALEEMKERRAEARAIGKIKEDLARLQAVDPDAPPTESERAALDALMAEMRREQQQAAGVGE